MAFPQYPSGMPGLGVILQRGNALCPESFVDIGRIGNINGPDASRATHKTSAHSRVPSTAHTYIPGMVEPGKLQFDLFIKTDTGQDVQMAEDFKLGTQLDWQLVYTVDSLNSVILASGFLDGFKLTHPVDGVVMAQVSIKLSGNLYYFSGGV